MQNNVEEINNEEKTKICKKCGEIKLLNEFPKHKNAKDGHINECKECKKLYTIEWKITNPEYTKEYNNEYRIKNAEKIKDYRNSDENKEFQKIYHKIYNEVNKDEVQQYHKIYNDINKVYHKEYRKKRYQDDPDKVYQQVLKSREKNKESYTIQKNEYRRKRYKEDPVFRIKCILRAGIYMSFKDKKMKKNTRTSQILDCTFKEFKIYIENKFESWMTWDNQGLYDKDKFNYGWDLDHIIPISSAVTEEDVIKLNHYSNFQPLCSKINRDIKRNKLDYEN